MARLNPEVDGAALAIMLLGLHDGWRTWKGIDWEVLNRLHVRGMITDPKSKARAVIFTEDGLEKSQRLFGQLSGRKTAWPTFPKGLGVEEPEGVLPKLSEFFGIAIYMYWGDHGPPHFHARYGGNKASIAIGDLSVLAGAMPPRALGLIVEWAALHRDELEVAWQKASMNEMLDPIEPLK